MQNITIAPQTYLRIYINPPLACMYCDTLTRVANAEKEGSADWLLHPVCATHGYASRDGKLGFSLHDEHNSIKRYVIEELSLQQVEPACILVRRCSLGKVKPLGYTVVEPLDVFANLRTYEACHIDDIAWSVRYTQPGRVDLQEVYVVWSPDLSTFELYQEQAS